jgi:hemoglobin-like flavoprotein
MMNTHTIALVQDSWEKVVPIADTAAQLFYAKLFELDPSLKPMFAHSDMPSQQKKLMQMITVAVRGLNRLDELVPAVQALGRRHVNYGVTDAHYDTVAAALLWTLSQGLGDAFTSELRDAWVETYTILATTMKGAGKQLAA